VLGYRRKISGATGDASGVATLTVPHGSCHFPPSSGVFSQGVGIVSVSATSFRRADLSHFFLGADRVRFRLTETDHVA